MTGPPDTLSDGAVDGAMRTYYGRRAAEYDQWYDREGRYDRAAGNAVWREDLAELAAWVRSLRAGRVLEIAAGTGRWTQVLAGACDVVACDYAPEMLVQCTARCRTAGLSVRYVRADAYALPFASAGFDAVFFGFWLSHVFPARMPEFVAEVARVLQPGGEVWVCDSGWSVDSGARDHERPPALGAGGVHRRKLNDGSEHLIYKQCFSAPLLADYLRAWGPAPETHESSEHFVWGRVRLDGGVS